MNFEKAFPYVLTVIVGLIAYFLRDMKISNDEKIRENKQEVEKVKDEFNQLKSELPFTYVTRDEFLRAMGSVENKLDKIYDKVIEKANEKVSEKKKEGYD